MGFPGGSVVKNMPANAGDAGLIPGLGRSPGGGNGNPLQCSCWDNHMDRGAWQATVDGVAKSWIRLSNEAWCTHAPSRMWDLASAPFLVCGQSGPEWERVFSSELSPIWTNYTASNTAFAVLGSFITLLTQTESIKSLKPHSRVFMTTSCPNLWGRFKGPRCQP